MMIAIPNVLSPEQVRQCRQALEGAQWSDGRSTAGHMALSVKQNLQLPADNQVSIEVGNFILDVIGQHSGFVSAALPLKVLPPMFNCYRGGGTYGNHVDNAIRTAAGSVHRVRTDISCTLFLSNPDEYVGGELTVEDTYGTRGVKLPAGHLVVYPGTSLHRVTPVTEGARFASIFWVQSFVRSDAQRSILYDLDTAIQQLTQSNPEDPALVTLTGVYHNLLRQWADT